MWHCIIHAHINMRQLFDLQSELEKFCIGIECLDLTGARFLTICKFHGTGIYLDTFAKNAFSPLT